MVISGDDEDLARIAPRSLEACLGETKWFTQQLWPPRSLFLIRVVLADARGRNRADARNNKVAFGLCSADDEAEAHPTQRVSLIAAAEALLPFFPSRLW
jgi:hypothetical protein